MSRPRKDPTPSDDPRLSSETRAARMALAAEEAGEIETLIAAMTHVLGVVLVEVTAEKEARDIPTAVVREEYEERLVRGSYGAMLKLLTWRLATTLACASPSIQDYCQTLALVRKVARQRRTVYERDPFP